MLRKTLHGLEREAAMDAVVDVAREYGKPYAPASRYEFPTHWRLGIAASQRALAAEASSRGSQMKVRNCER